MTGPERAAAWRAEGHYLEACPFCKNILAPKLLHRSAVADDFDAERVCDCFAVVCDATAFTTEGRGCGGSSGFRSTPEKAADAWNQRARGPQ